MSEARIDPRDLRDFRSMTIVDVNETEYRIIGDYIERRQVLDDNPDCYTISHICAMEPANVVEMTQKIQHLQTQDKATIHRTIKEYMLAEDHAMPPAPGRKLLGLLSEEIYMLPNHTWKKPAVVSKEIARIE